MCVRFASLIFRLFTYYYELELVYHLWDFHHVIFILHFMFAIPCDQGSYTILACYGVKALCLESFLNFLSFGSGIIHSSKL